ncbi:MAG: hypothetical protein NTX03_08275 [Bacteroidetes bacterium]|nr:hypothetical protein [Bacteroidota bacterium]
MSTTQTTPTLLNPFPGLRSFGEAEGHLFFGRDAQINELIRKLSLYRFISIVGTSGSGKSSLVRAGLLNAIKQGRLDENETPKAWKIKIITPGTNPIGNLAKSIDEGDKNSVEPILKESTLGLVQAMRPRLQPNENLLLVVDQFEELFRFAEHEKGLTEADHFVALLIEAAKQKDVPIFIVITLRADFLGDCTRFEGLPEAINNGQYLIPRLSAAEKRETITAPVKFAEGKISPMLVQRLLDDVGNNPDQLPILQHALMRTWEYWKTYSQQGDPMEILHYENIGTLSKALNQHADEAYFELNGNQQIICAKIFKCLTVKGDDNRGIRRPNSVKNIAEITGEKADDIIKIVNVFRKAGRGFIMPAEPNIIAENTVLDISHESLMRVWERLGIWVDEEAQAALMYKRLTESALLYEEGKSALWRNPELELALDWKEKNTMTEKWTLQYNTNFKNVSSFLAASIKNQEEETKDKKRRRTLINIGIAVFLLFSSILTLWALRERATASANYEDAMKQGKIAKTQEQIAHEKEQEAERNSKIAQTERSKAEDQRSKAEIEKAEAEKQKRIALEKEYEAQLQRKLAEESSIAALNSKKTAEEKGKEAILERDKAENMRKLAETNEKKATNLHRLSNSHYLAIKSLQVQDKELKALLAYYAYKFNKDYGGKPNDADIYAALSEFNLSYGSRLNSTHTEVKALAYSPDGTQMISAGGEGQLLAWKLSESTTPKLITTVKNQLIKSVAFISNDDIAIGSDNGIIQVFSINKAKEKYKQQIHKGAVNSIFYNDNKIYSAGADKTVKILDASTLNVVKTISITGIPFAITVTKNNTAYVGCDIGAVYQIPKEGRSAVLFSQEKSKINCISVSENAKYLAMGLASGELVIYRPETGKKQIIKAHNSAISSVSINPDNSQIATASFDNSIKIFSTENPDDAPYEIRKHSSYVLVVCFNKDGKQLASGSKDIRISQVNPKDMAETLKENLTRNLTTYEWKEYIGDDVKYEELDLKK